MATEESKQRGSFRQEVHSKEARKLEAQRQGKQNVWHGFSVFGLIGWSVSIPTVLFVLLGMWLDKRYEAEQSFTLALLVAGLCIGCFNAWYWVSRKMKGLD